MTNKICENCKWWDKYNYNDDFGSCDEWCGEAECIDTHRINFMDVRSIDAGKNFGCIHWKSKDNGGGYL